MSLPVISYPVFEITIPSTKQKCSARPFTVKEHKLLLQNNELGDTQSFMMTMEKIILSCLSCSVDTKNLAFYDLDYLFLALRARSVGELLPISFTCKAKTEDDSVCDTKILLNLDINAVMVKFPDEFTNNQLVKVSETVGIKFRAPKLRDYELIKRASENSINGYSISTEYIFSCIESIFDGDKIMIPGVDFTLEEIEEWLDLLPIDASKQVDLCLTNMPHVLLKTELQCPKCKNKATIEVKDLEGFFV